MPGNIAAPGPEVRELWPAPNFDNPTTRDWLPAWAISVHALTTIVAAVRICLRLKGKAGGIGADDNAWTSQLVFVIGTGLLKISTLLFYRRIVEGTFRRRWKYAVWIAIGFTIAYSLVLVTMLCVNCDPLQAYWKAYDPEWNQNNQFHCHDTTFINPVAGALTIASDVYSVVLPCIMCAKLALPRRQKIALYGVFCLGLVVVGASCGRTHALWKLGVADDITWVGFWVFFWCILEYDLGIFCTCVPPLRVLFKRQLKVQTTSPQSEQSFGTPAKGLHDTDLKSWFDDESPEDDTAVIRNKHVRSENKSISISRAWNVVRHGEDEQPIIQRPSPTIEQIPLHIVRSPGRDSYRMGRESPRM